MNSQGMTVFATSLSLAFVSVTHALAGGGHTHSGDIGLAVDGGRIVTGALEQGVFHEERIFAGEFGGGGIFNFTDEPGFDAPDGTFPSQTLVGFNILSSLGEWNGAGFDVADETLTVSFGTLTRETSSGFVAGFGLLTDADGGWHRHLGFTLNGVSQSDSGVYLLELEMWHESASIAPSEPFFIVFDFNADPAAHDAAIAHVEQMLGGEVATLADVQAVFGSIQSGGVAELSASDDAYLEARSQFGFSAQEPNLIQLLIGADAGGHSPTSLDVMIESRLNNPGGTLGISLRDWKAGQFMLIGQFPVGQQEVEHHVHDVDAANRVRVSDGRIELRVKYSVIATFSAAGFDAFVDLTAIELFE